MQGNMMNQPLLISQIIQHAEQYHSQAEIVSRTVEGGIHRYTYRDAAARSRKLAKALSALGIQVGDSIGTLAWNTYRHYECYFGISGLGAVMNTINPRLFAEQMTYIVNHSRDRYIMVDANLLPLLEANAAGFETLEGYIVMTDRAHMPETRLDNVLCYEELIEGQDDDYEWPQFDENTAAALCYTSGTTGNPKGVLYSHRSTMIHAMAAAAPDALNISSRTSLLPVVPMFHVNAWGVPYAASMHGSKMVFPGPALDGASLWELIDAEQTNLLLGVPTVWLALLQYMDSIGKTLESVNTVVVGGSAAPESMIRTFHQKHGAFLLHAWGMTEMSPLGTLTTPTPHMDSLSDEDRYKLQTKQGKATFGVEMKILGEDGAELPHDGEAFGRLMVRGPWIVDSYFRTEGSALEDGWFDTGDVATIDPAGYMQIVDRSKDVIKSGGEWISSIDLENAAVGHPDVAEACVIGAAHPKWDERPLLLAVPVEGREVTLESVNSFLADKVAKWWLPDALIQVEALPHTATGKLHKVPLRETYYNYLNEQESAS
ncbi:MAG: long-chain-fatty-acid--CoA ligase [Gammaproteobacteria bacterium AqS3]|nr:long-chain-fatty-acid--CoA ligase [Gammaproteobacteria bacterium AqS3]